MPDEHLGEFQFLAVVPNAAKNILGYLPQSTCACISWGVSRSGIADSSLLMGS